MVPNALRQITAAEETGVSIAPWILLNPPFFLQWKGRVRLTESRRSSNNPTVACVVYMCKSDGTEYAP